MDINNTDSDSSIVDIVIKMISRKDKRFRKENYYECNDRKDEWKEERSHINITSYIAKINNIIIEVVRHSDNFGGLQYGTERNAPYAGNKTSYWMYITDYCGKKRTINENVSDIYDKVAGIERTNRVFDENYVCDL